MLEIPLIYAGVGLLNRKEYRRRRRYNNFVSILVIAFVTICSMFPSIKSRIYQTEQKNAKKEITETIKNNGGNYESGTTEKYTVINNNDPGFSKIKLNGAKKSYKKFSELDKLGRCGMAEASIGKDMLPTEKRRSIGMVKPTGWHTVRYDNLIKDKYLYNRCHLIAFCLSGENANEKNLITGTRYMNTEGMLPFETQVLDYVRKTGNHVLYQVTPVFKGNNLVANGVYMKAESVEDNGKGLKFSVFVNNIQPGIEIDYETGESRVKK